MPGWTMLLAGALQATAAPPPAPAAAPAAAPPPVAVAPLPQAPTDEQRIARSAQIGSILFAFDHAAAVSSDALTAKVPKDQLTGLGGYVAEAADAQTLRVTYYRGSGDQARAFFVATVRDGKVAAADLLPDPVPLTPAQARMARAREIAAQAAVAKNYRPCTTAPFNTVVLPSREGPVAVYLLSAQTDARQWPMGGHYRFVIDPDGKILSDRAFSVSCLNIDLPGQKPAEGQPVGLVVNHLLDPVPTEIHVFSSFKLRLSLFVPTPTGQVWRVTGRTIVPADVKAP